LRFTALAPSARSLWGKLLAREKWAIGRARRNSLYSRVVVVTHLGRVVGQEAICVVGIPNCHFGNNSLVGRMLAHNTCEIAEQNR
jgi:hypothetical protein